MRTMLVTRNFPPLVGGMERVSKQIVATLARRGQVTLVAPQGSASHVPASIVVREVRLKPLVLFLAMSWFHSCWTALWSKPSLILAGSGLTAPHAVVCAWISGGRSAAYLHGLDIIVRSRIYQAIWLPFIRHCDVVLVNSGSTKQLAISAGVAPARIHVVHPGTEIPELLGNEGKDFRASHGLGDRPIIISVGRFTRRKGLAEFVEFALPQLIKEVPNLMLLIVGSEASDALHGAGESEQERISAVAAGGGLSENVHFFGRCSEEELRGAYCASACHVFPILDVPGDIEGFGMVAIEAAAHGVPTVAFAVGGVTDSVSEPASGTLVAPRAYGAFAEATLAYVVSSRSAEQTNFAKQFARTMDWDEFSRGLLESISVA